MEAQKESKFMTSVGSLLVDATTRIGAMRAGLSKKTVRVNGTGFHYYDGGKGEPLVLLHGLADDKSSFLSAASGLTRRFRVILPDLAGHGENAREPEKDYSIRGHVGSLHAFLDALGLERVHLGGNSMGGHTALAYAIHHPERVLKLVLINAPGLAVDDHEVYTGFGAGMNTIDDFNAVLDRVFFRRPKMPGPVIRHLMAQLRRNFDFTNSLVRAVKEGEDFVLNDRVGEVRAPTLILWGKHDVVIKFNVAEAYCQRIKNCSLVLLDEAAHSPQLEAPRAVADAIAKFLSAPPASKAAPAAAASA